jgi:putative ABC transport system ATP-binding protein
MSYLELRDVSKVYGEGPVEVHALRRVDLSVDAGSLVAIMGASGSGKSTLLTIAGSLEDPTNGEVYIGDRALSSLSRNGKAQLRRQSIGYVFQDYNLLAGLSAVENVSLPLELDGVAARKAQLAAMETLDDFGLADRASHYPDQLSGGERQRVAIARAVVGGRQLLLADEPSGALDSTNAESVLRLMRSSPRGPIASSSCATAASSTRRCRSRAPKHCSPTRHASERRRPRAAGHGRGSHAEQRRCPSPPSHAALGLAPLPA